MADSERITVYYLSSGRLGVPVLDALHTDSRIALIGIGTQPDRPAGRKRRLTATPVGCHADVLGLSAERIRSVNDTVFLDTLRTLAPQIIVVASFGQILRPSVLTLPAFGCFNVHASLLPRHRGASPVTAALLAGDSETGVSFMSMDEGLDTGPVYEQFPVPIGDTDTSDTLEDRLAALAAERIGDCLWRVVRDGLRPCPQDDDCATYAPKLKKSDGRIDWSQPAAQIARAVRAYTPWPRTFTTVAVRGKNRRLQIISAVPRHPGASRGSPGEVIQADAGAFRVACGDGVLELLRVVPEGRGEMSSEAFLRGYPIGIGNTLGQETTGG